ASAMPASSSWPHENPALAPSWLHSKAKTAPMSTTTALDAQGSNCCRSWPASCPTTPRCAAAALLPLAAAVDAVHLASPAWLYRATAVIAAISPASPGSDQDGLAPNPRKCAMVPTDPPLVVSHAISGAAASIASVSAAVIVVAQPTSQARPSPRSRSSRLSRASRPPALRPPGSSVLHQ